MAVPVSGSRGPTLVLGSISDSQRPSAALSTHFNTLFRSAGLCLVGVSDGMFVREGFSVTAYKPVQINIVFLQLGLLTGCEPGAVTRSQSQLWNLRNLTPDGEDAVSPSSSPSSLLPSAGPVVRVVRVLRSIQRCQLCDGPAAGIPAGALLAVRVLHQIQRAVQGLPLASYGEESFVENHFKGGQTCT